MGSFNRAEQQWPAVGIIMGGSKVESAFRTDAECLRALLQSNLTRDTDGHNFAASVARRIMR